MRMFLLFLLVFPSVLLAEATPVVGGDEIVTILQNRDKAKLQALFDSTTLAEQVADQLSLNESDRAGFVKGMREGMADFPAVLIAQLEQLQPVIKLIRTREKDGRYLHLVRFDKSRASAGYDYFEFECDSDGHIIDWFVHSQGNRISAVVIQLVAGALGNRRTPETAGAIADEEQTQLKTWQDFYGHMRAGRYQPAYEALERFPEDFRQTRDWAALRVRIAGAVGNEQYQSSLDHLASQFSDVAELQFLLIDHYFLKQQFDQSLRAITAFEQFVGEDGITNLLKCNVQVAAGQTNAAIQSCQHGIDIEPDQASLYWSLVAIGLDLEKPNLVLTVLSQYEQAFAIQFDPVKLTAKPNFAKLASTAEYQRWAESRTAAVAAESNESP